jgi:hypothetical protein
MMKMIRCTLLLACCMFAVAAIAQHPLDRYLAGTPTPTTIGTTANAGLDKPVDLEFNLKPGRRHELWVLNRDDNQGSSMSIFYHAGKPQQVIEKRKDSHRGHFMINCPAFAMSDTGDFTTVQEVLNSTGHQTETFMGPVLWTSDTNVFARYYQSNWDPSEPLGSHIDMLHQSPYAMGVAWEKDNIYWVFDGYNGNIVSYNFQTPHDIGADDHSDGILKRYTEVQVKRTVDKPSHMVIDHKTGWLYIVDNGNKRVLRLDINSGTRSTNISNPYEPLEEYYRMRSVKWEVFIDSGLVMPVGIDVMDGRLVVTDNSNGDIIFYDLTKNKKNAEIGRVKTGKAGIAGITIAPDSTLWYVNTTANEVVHLQPSNAPGNFSLLYPINSVPGPAPCYDIDDTLKWTASINAVKYRVELSDSIYNDKGLIKFVQPILDTIVTDLSLPYFVPVNYLDYYWRVTAINSEGDSTYSDTWMFKSRSASTQQFSPLNRSSDVSDPVKFTWVLTGANYYRVQVATDSLFAQIVSDTTISNTSLTIAGLAPSTTYYWRLNASSAEYCPSVWTETWSFTRNSLGVHDVRSVASVSVYPNPANSEANISLSLTEATHLNISLYSILGENVLTVHNGFTHEGVNNFTADVSKLAAGIYHLRIETSIGVVTKQIVVQ